MLEINVLGPMEATGAGRCIAPTAAKPRQVLALLALRAGEVVSVSTLVEEIWGEKPPRSALTTLQTYILQLRRLIGGVLLSGSAKDVLLTRYNGYLFTPEGVMVDAQLYDGLVDEANQASENGDHLEAYRLARRALDLWSGRRWSTSCGGPISASRPRVWSRAGWVCSRPASTPNCIWAGTTCCSASWRCWSPAIRCTSFCAKLMVALYRSGQRWRALEVYQTVRTELADGLGLEPSVRLQQLQHAILSADPSLDFVAPNILFTQPTLTLRGNGAPAVPAPGRSFGVGGLGVQTYLEQLRARHGEGAQRQRCAAGTPAVRPPPAGWRCPSSVRCSRRTPARRRSAVQRVLDEARLCREEGRGRGEGLLELLGRSRHLELVHERHRDRARRRTDPGDDLRVAGQRLPRARAVERRVDAGRDLAVPVQSAVREGHGGPPGAECLEVDLDEARLLVVEDRLPVRADPPGQHDPLGGFHSTTVPQAISVPSAPTS